MNIENRQNGMSGEYLFEVFMQAPLPIAILMGPEFRFVLSNSLHREMTQRDDIVGKTIREVFPQNEVKDFIPILEEVYATGKSFRGTELPLTLTDGNGREYTQYIDVVYQLFTIDDGTRGVLAFHHDVSDRVRARKAVENEHENYRRLFRQTPEMVCILLGPNHVFEFVNQAHIEALGFDATGMAVREAQPESVEVHGILDNVYQTGVTAELREIPVTIGKKLRYFNLTYAARRGIDGNVNGVLILGSEITEQFEARQAILEAKEASDAANKSKTDFIANMSHEIRTPIGVVMGFCELMRDPTLTPQEREDYLDRVISNAKGLNRVIDDILDISKVEAGKFDIEEIEFCLRDLLQDTLELFADKARSKNIQLSLSMDKNIPPQTVSDPSRLRQILMNIVGNAIKFTTLGSVEIFAKAIPSEVADTKYEIEVRDTGIGLSEAQVDKLFQPFGQADTSTSRQYGGTGLGLVISKRLANALGGDVTVRQFAVGEGCTFLITFYDRGLSSEILPTDSLVSPKPIEPDRESLRGLTILLAEDTIDNQLLVKRILQKAGARVDVAQDGEEAIQKALNPKLHFDVILMDVQMPRVDGYEATRALRYNKYSRPIIALTAHAMLEEKVKSSVAGCDAHLTKPIVPSELIATIERFARRSQP